MRLSYRRKRMNLKKEEEKKEILPAILLVRGKGYEGVNCASTRYKNTYAVCFQKPMKEKEERRSLETRRRLRDEEKCVAFT